MIGLSECECETETVALNTLRVDCTCIRNDSAIKDSMELMVTEICRRRNCYYGACPTCKYIGVVVTVTNDFTIRNSLTSKDPTVKSYQNFMNIQEMRSKVTNNILLYYVGYHCACKVGHR